MFSGVLTLLSHSTDSLNSKNRCSKEFGADEESCFLSRKGVCVVRNACLWFAFSYPGGHTLDRESYNIMASNIIHRGPIVYLTYDQRRDLPHSIHVPL